MIERLSQIIARILGQKDLKSAEEALLEIDQAGKMFAGLDRMMISSFSTEDLISLMHAGGAFDTNKCLAIAELQYAEGQVLEACQDESECKLRFQRSLRFLLEAITEDRNIPAGRYDERIEILQQKLHDIVLPPALQKKLFRYYEGRGAYAKAEDVLFELLETNPAESPDDGIVFYKRLLLKTDEELEKGNLPRKEIEEGLQKLLHIEKT
jgi:tetratricopeptide (TPR) repeat protein